MNLPLRKWKMQLNIPATHFQTAMYYMICLWKAVFFPGVLETTKTRLCKKKKKKHEFILLRFYDPIYAIMCLKSKHFVNA